MLSTPERSIDDTTGSATGGATPAGSAHDEATDLLSALAHHRGLLLRTVQGLDDEQATRRTTVSELSLAGVVKHVAGVERGWTAFVLEGAGAIGNFSEMTEADLAAWGDAFRLLPGETLAGVLADYEAVAERTAEVFGSLEDLSAARALPEAPWFEAGASWSARRVLVHVLAETTQHAGHADIIREALDGQKTMG
ncbi:DinB family protein [Streptomyces spiramenti]|uniref:DinB family protein n=1 Tax=Streptomyces spiramenti TaxID=2720606 RepID=A0ABX1AI45_9ACTN|nr:DinB family protein [Streptomyces spiramenti]NJP66834.1 DinB family protein [Streptomyces spiramenti]